MRRPDNIPPGGGPFVWAGHLPISGAPVDVAVDMGLARQNAEPAFGYYDPFGPTIYIHPSLTGERAMRTVLHELIHHVEELMDVELSHHQVRLVATVLTILCHGATLEALRDTVAGLPTLNRSWST